MHNPKTMATINKLQLESGIRSIDVNSTGNILVGLEDSILMEVSNLTEGSPKTSKILEVSFSFVYFKMFK
jgi:hypothetical protein